MDTINDLRKKIDERHRKALQALQAYSELQEYLGEPVSLKGSTNSHGGNAKKIPLARRARPGSMRAKVLAIIQHKWATIDEIAEQSKIDAKKVRGVINAPALKHELEAKTDGEKKLYHVKETA